MLTDGFDIFFWPCFMSFCMCQNFSRFEKNTLVKLRSKFTTLSLSLFYYDKNVYTVFYWYLRAYYTLIAHMQKSHYRTIFFQLILVTTLKRIMKYYRLAGVSQTTAKLNEIVCLTKTNLAQIAFVTFCFNRDNKKVGKNPLFSWSKLGNFTKLLKRIAVILF